MPDSVVRKTQLECLSGSLEHHEENVRETERDRVAAENAEQSRETVRSEISIPNLRTWLAPLPSILIIASASKAR